MVLTGGVHAHSVSDDKNTEAAPGAEGEKMSLTAPRMAWSARTDWVTADGGISMTQGAMGKSNAQRCRDGRCCILTFVFISTFTLTNAFLCVIC